MECTTICVQCACQWLNSSCDIFLHNGAAIFFLGGHLRHSGHLRLIGHIRHSWHIRHLRHVWHVWHIRHIRHLARLARLRSLVRLRGRVATAAILFVCKTIVIHTDCTFIQPRVASTIQSHFYVQAHTYPQRAYKTTEPNNPARHPTLTFCWGRKKEPAGKFARIFASWDWPFCMPPGYPPMTMPPA